MRPSCAEKLDLSLWAKMSRVGPQNSPLLFNFVKVIRDKIGVFKAKLQLMNYWLGFPNVR